MIEVRQTGEFREWLTRLKDQRAVAAIVGRIARLEVGHLGDVKSIGDGVSELRIHYGPGYRLYAARRGDVLVILLSGGDKSSQDRDIRRAKAMARELET